MAKKNHTTRQVGTSYSRFPPSFRSKVRKKTIKVDDERADRILIVVGVTSGIIVAATILFYFRQLPHFGI